MKLIIEIDEEDYIFAKREVPDGRIANGIPLPKGRMIILSEDAVKRAQVPLSFSCQKWLSEVGLSNATIRIIEADTESEDCNNCKWYDEDRIYNPNCENCCRNYKDNYCRARTESEG